jgi:hypothetical protein
LCSAADTSFFCESVKLDLHIFKEFLSLAEHENGAGDLHSGRPAGTGGESPGT